MRLILGPLGQLSLRQFVASLCYLAVEGLAYTGEPSFNSNWFRPMKAYSLRCAFAFTALLAMLTLQFPAFAHTALSASQPADGETVSAPAALTLDFAAPVSLLVLSVTGNTGEVDIGFAPRAEASPQHKIALPTLAAGRYTVDWTIVGADGHKISKSFSFTVE
jgi:methionine-rich copper-binding protein CopC